MPKMTILDRVVQTLPKKTTIRRYHGTRIRRVPDIIERGLLKDAPLNRTSKYFVEQYPEAKAVYTTTLPVESYFDPTDPYDALVVLDIPKDWYRSAPRQSRNLEGLYIGNGFNPSKEWPENDAPWSDWYDRISVQQGGRVDIFDTDIPPEFITEVLQPDPSMLDSRWTNYTSDNPKLQLNRIKTGGDPIPFDEIEGFSKFRPYWLWREGKK